MKKLNDLTILYNYQAVIRGRLAHLERPDGTVHRADKEKYREEKQELEFLNEIIEQHRQRCTL